jgi:hypothetical protein
MAWVYQMNAFAGQPNALPPVMPENIAVPETLDPGVPA